MMPGIMKTGVPWVLAGLLLAASVACEKDEKKIRLVVDSEVPWPDEVDGVEIRVAASETDEGSICAPARREFNDADFPVIVYYVIGPRFDAWFAARVTFSKDGGPVYVRDVIRPVTGILTQEIRVTFEAACLDVACPEGQQCLAGVCEDTHQPSVFDDPSIAVDTSVSCD
jgi:hypothetical protein